jgi:hypothetical protein
MATDAKGVEMKGIASTGYVKLTTLVITLAPLAGIAASIRVRA